MNKKFLVGGAIAAFIAIVSMGTALAASDSYKFVVRGNVTKVDKDNKTITVYANHASERAKEDLAGDVVEYKASTAKVYKWVKGKKVRITLGGVPVGNEVVMEGAKNKNGNFGVTKITVNDNAFSIVGTLRGRNEDNKTLSVDISYTDYKSTTFKGKRVTFYYGGNTKFYNRSGAEINADEIANGDEQVKITGTVTSGNKWEALKVWDDYPKAK